MVLKRNSLTRSRSTPEFFYSFTFLQVLCTLYIVLEFLLFFLQENEKSRDIIIDQRFHGTIIGARGENIREIREKFNQVQITFPDPGKKSDIVTLRGPKNDVDKCYKHLQSMHKDMVRN